MFFVVSASRNFGPADVEVAGCCIAFGIGAFESKAAANAAAKFVARKTGVSTKVEQDVFVPHAGNADLWDNEVHDAADQYYGDYYCPEYV